MPNLSCHLGIGPRQRIECGMHSPPESRQHRTIRSFVRRTGRLTPSQQRALVDRWPSYGVDFNAEVIDFDTLFDRCAPVALEIGFGNGDTLVQQALDNLSVNFVGIEVHEPGVGHCLIQARHAGLTNLKLIKHDAIDVLRHQIPADSLRRINIYVPDPWPKKRHHKRRMIQTDFLELIDRCLIPDGALHIATDWANYAEYIDEVLDRSVLFTCNERRKHDGSEPLDRPRTKFEQRGLQKGHHIWDWRVTRAANNE